MTSLSAINGRSRKGRSLAVWLVVLTSIAWIGCVGSPSQVAENREPQGAEKREPRNAAFARELLSNLPAIERDCNRRQREMFRTENMTAICAVHGIDPERMMLYVDNFVGKKGDVTLLQRQDNQQYLRFWSIGGSRVAIAVSAETLDGNTLGAVLIAYE